MNMNIRIIYLDDLNAINTLSAKINLIGHRTSIEKLEDAPRIDSTVDILIVYIEKNLHSNTSLESLVQGYSFDVGARIIAIHSIDKKSNKVPAIIDQLADAIVCCDDNFIRRAIDGENIFVDAECRLPKKKEIIRHSC